MARQSLLVLYGLALVVKIGTIVWSAVKLPEHLATHFGLSGAADGWASRSSYLAFSIVMSALVVIGMPLLARAATAGSGVLLNIPNKDYWLRDENRPELRRRLTDDMLFAGALTALLLAWVDVLVVQANRSASPTLGASVWVAMGVYLVVILGWTVRLSTKRYAVPAS